jgi:MFS family permease
MMVPVPHNESSPLLPPSNEQETASSTSYNGKITPLRRLAVGLFYVAVFLVFEISILLVSVPMSPIQEAIICRKYYPDAAKTSPVCKSEVVQSELSMLKGWEITFGLLPGMLTAVPYGMVADKYGFKVVLGLSLLGLTLSQAIDIVICMSQSDSARHAKLTENKVVSPKFFLSA